MRRWDGIYRPAYAGTEFFLGELIEEIRIIIGVKVHVVDVDLDVAKIGRKI